MARLYSHLFYSNVLGAPIGPEPVYEVPVGFVAIIRDIEAYNTGIYWRANMSGFQVTDDIGAVIASTSANNALAAVLYSWRGRQVLLPGDHINLFTGEDSWSIRISGYLLSTP